MNLITKLYQIFFFIVFNLIYIGWFIIGFKYLFELENGFPFPFFISWGFKLFIILFFIGLFLLFILKFILYKFFEIADSKDDYRDYYYYLTFSGLFLILISTYNCILLKYYLWPISYSNPLDLKDFLSIIIAFSIT